MSVSLLTALLTLPAVVAAQSESDSPRLIRDQDGYMTYWLEEETDLPPYPSEQDLRRIVPPMARPTNTYLIDERSLALGRDGVLRYTVVIRSNSGAVNVLHEGLQCETREYKTYAYGDSGGAFRRVQDSGWKRISRRGTMGYRWSFADQYACDETHGPIPAAEVVARLRAGGQPGEPVHNDSGQR